jgi:aryl-alcohol dehydrogenase-like predicted oxidoreductase
MRYKLLGRSGMRVSQLALGTMTFGEDWGWGASKEDSRKIFERFAEAGGNFVDTSCNYTNGTSERFVGKFTATDRDHFVVATKYTLTSRPEDPNAGGNHPRNMVRSLEGSLERLGTDHVDVLWLHMWDDTTPVEEIMRAFDGLVRSGKVLHVAFSDTPAWVVSRAVTIAELRGWPRPVAIQVPYSLADRSVERQELPMARSLGLGITPWGLLEGGVLTGKYNLGSSDEPRRYGDEQQGEKELQLATVLKGVADEVGASAAQVAINWIRQQPGTMVPILGARRLDQLEDDLRCLDFELTEDQMTRLTEASPISLGFPRSFLESNGVRGLIFGSTFDLIDR